MEGDLSEHSEIENSEVVRFEKDEEDDNDCMEVELNEYSESKICKGGERC